MAKFGRGLICLTLNEQRCNQLSLPMMTKKNEASFGTNFTVSIEAAEGVTTGISAADRSHTISVAVSAHAKPDDIVQPGHVFPLKAEKGGVLMRAGHTEAGCDLAELAGLTPAAVICEILKEDGAMARLPDLIKFSKKHNLKIGSIADLIKYRSQTESMIEKIAVRNIFTEYGDFKGVIYRDKPSGGAHLALVHGQINSEIDTLVRVHQPVTLLDLLESKTSHHSWTISGALKEIKRSTQGIIVLLNCEESPNQMFSRFNSQEPNLNFNTTNHRRYDLRTYGIGAQILRELGVKKMILLANPRKMPSMTGFNLEIVGYKACQEIKKGGLN
tara:strand:- start:11 stop:1000 length:990 start_codon:yes stop_codon:yes gene_type:complete